MSVVQWKAIYDRLAALEAKVEALTARPPLDVEYTLPPAQTPDQFIATIKRRPGRPRKER